MSSRLIPRSATGKSAAPSQGVPVVLDTLYAKGVLAMGEAQTLAVIACLLQKGSEVASAGGYLTSLIKQAEEGQFSLDALLMPLMRKVMMLN